MPSFGLRLQLVGIAIVLAFGLQSVVSAARASGIVEGNGVLVSLGVGLTIVGLVYPMIEGRSGSGSTE